jgi:hypothetical protein
VHAAPSAGSDVDFGEIDLVSEWSGVLSAMFMKSKNFWQTPANIHSESRRTTKDS